MRRLGRGLGKRDGQNSRVMWGAPEMKTKKRQPSRADFHVKNDILHALLNSEYKHLNPKLEHVALKRGEIIY